MNKNDVPIKVAIVDDQILFLRGLAMLLGNIEGIECVLQASNGKELLEKIETQKPDVILLDLQMPVMSGIEALEVVKNRYSKIGVILLTMHNDERLIQQVVELGANGYLLKNEEPKEIEKAIRSVMAKDLYLNDYVSKALFRTAQAKNKKEIKLTQYGIHIKLTNREIEILELICMEMSNTEIAKELFLSVRTVEAHRRNLLQKTNVRNSAGLVIFAIRNNLVKVA